MSSNTLRRQENLQRARSEETWDIIVIGGGATGLGTAVDAAARVRVARLGPATDLAVVGRVACASLRQRCLLPDAGGGVAADGYPCAGGG